jgi:hypothetical protein
MTNTEQKYQWLLAQMDLQDRHSREDRECERRVAAIAVKMAKTTKAA